jgi:hypothetical protein
MANRAKEGNAKCHIKKKKLYNERPWKEIYFERAALSGLGFFNRSKNKCIRNEFIF